MITISDLQKLQQSWQDRLDSTIQPLAYRDALSECIYDISVLINSSIEEELSYQDFLSQQADDYLSSEENYYATAI